MNNITDKVIKCLDCAQEFAFTADEQEYYRTHQLVDPVRCPMCRAAYKAAKEDRFRGQRK